VVGWLGAWVVSIIRIVVAASLLCKIKNKVTLVGLNLNLKMQNTS